MLVAQGGLMSYGPDLADLVRRAAGYVARILRGEYPGALPYYQPTTFYLTINLGTAKALGLIVPPALLASAVEVIDLRVLAARRAKSGGVSACQVPATKSARLQNR